MDSRQSAEDLVEIYHTDSTAEARKILDVILTPEGVEGVIHDRVNHAFPAPASEPSEVGIAVPSAQVDQAIALLTEAKQAGYVAGEIVLTVQGGGATPPKP